MIALKSSYNFFVRSITWDYLPKKVHKSFKVAYAYFVVKCQPQILDCLIKNMSCSTIHFQTRL